ncbi:MAG TPA: flagellar motor switch protein FliN [Steroidobacter sp.]|nr:flagellar motor switch protein FliN [Steroidobacteraceae bacterium]HLS80769.1 flagellar motor switch protein FliN [Steroidobacter sp.]
MNANATDELGMLSELPDTFAPDMPAGQDEPQQQAPDRAPTPRRNFAQMMRKIPVTLTLEVGAARISLQDLARLDANSVVELDTLAGEPLTIKVNGAPIGRAEVVVSGENYGLKVLELSDLDLDSLDP